MSAPVLKIGTIFNPHLKIYLDISGTKKNQIIKNNKKNWQILHSNNAIEDFNV